MKNNQMHAAADAKDAREDKHEIELSIDTGPLLAPIVRRLSVRATGGVISAFVIALVLWHYLA